jgi:hypothetical protein
VRSRVLPAICVAVFCACFVIIVAKNVKLNEEVGRLRDARSGGHGRELEVGDSLGRFELRDYKGQRADPTELLEGRRNTIVHFLRRRCGACIAELASWEDYFRLAGNANVVFVVYDEGDARLPVTPLANSTLPLSRTYSIAVQAPARSRIPFVPATAVVDACGIVTAVYRSVDQIPIAGGSP